MSTQALIMMITTVTVVTCITGYFFYKVLTTPPRSEPDSYEDNDDQPR
ncbi:MAG TPA: hypothetical protein PKL06_05505 [Chitinophagales bacterium]|nr:hypothetical protein [Chitinophagales bacterium]